MVCWKTPQIVDLYDLWVFDMIYNLWLFVPLPIYLDWNWFKPCMPKFNIPWWPSRPLPMSKRRQLFVFFVWCAIVQNWFPVASLLLTWHNCSKIGTWVFWPVACRCCLGWPRKIHESTNPWFPMRFTFWECWYWKRRVLENTCTTAHPVHGSKSNC